MPDVFISVHNNGATNRHACWGFVHEGDQYEQQNRELAKEFVVEICRVSGLENAGVLGDSSPNRNDYRCKNTGKLSFYSLDENVNTAPIRVLLEIGDNKVSYEFLMNPENQKRIGEAIQRVIERRFGRAVR
jgi:N-acetylmuramoyl-L-alanine amidase